jgi:hypothetical protein
MVSTRASRANAADLVPAVEKYLAANGLSETLSAMKAETKRKNLTPGKTVRGVTVECEDCVHRHRIECFPFDCRSRRRRGCAHPAETTNQSLTFPTIICADYHRPRTSAST